MPFAERIRKVAAKGPPEVITDNGGEIAKELAAWNDAHGGVATGGCTAGSATRASTPLLFLMMLGALALRRWRRRAA